MYDEVPEDGTRLPNVKATRAKIERLDPLNFSPLCWSAIVPEYVTDVPVVVMSYVHIDRIWHVDVFGDGVYTGL